MEAKTLSYAAAVVALGAAESHDHELVGGKAAGLARLLAMEVAVPRGLCLTTAAFSAWVEHHGLGATTAALTELLPDPAAADQLAELVRRHPLPPALLDALGAELAALSAANGYAVRSSGVGEDDAETSFAGQHTTVVGVSAADVPAAVAECWASTWSRDALAYRSHLDLPLPALAIPVVVQELVPAVASAIVFTADPVTGDAGEIVVNVIRGLGEPLARGAITPDSYVVHKRTKVVLEATAGEPDANVSLRRHELRLLVEACDRIERAFGFAVDVEASLADGRWLVLQARPLTAAVGT